MADRSFHHAQVQGIRHVEYNFSVLYAAGAPSFNEGDKVGALVGSYVSMVQTGAGVLTFTTVDKFPAVVRVTAGVGMAVPNGNSITVCGKPTQNANGSWSFTVNTYVNAAGVHTATTPANGDLVNVCVVLRNSTSLP